MAAIELKALKEFEVRFNEVDSMGIVWHGCYAMYFEDGRGEFGKKYGLSYMKMFESGFYAPFVDLNFQYKKPLSFQAKAIVETKYINTEAAKIHFEYRIFLPEDNSTICTGSSVQVFLNKDYQLEWFNPPFYEAWKVKMGLL